MELRDSWLDSGTQSMGQHLTHTSVLQWAQWKPKWPSAMTPLLVHPSTSQAWLSSWNWPKGIMCPLPQRGSTKPFGVRWSWKEPVENTEGVCERSAPEDAVKLLPDSDVSSGETSPLTATRAAKSDSRLRHVISTRAPRSVEDVMDDCDDCGGKGSGRLAELAERPGRWGERTSQADLGGDLLKSGERGRSEC